MKASESMELAGKRTLGCDDLILISYISVHKIKAQSHGSMALAIQKAAHSGFRMCCFFTDSYRRKNQPFFFLP